MSQVLGWLLNRDEPRIALGRLGRNVQVKLRRGRMILIQSLVFISRWVVTRSIQVVWENAWVSLVTKNMEKVSVPTDGM